MKDLFKTRNIWKANFATFFHVCVFGSSSISLNIPFPYKILAWMGFAVSFFSLWFLWLNHLAFEERK